MQSYAHQQAEVKELRSSSEALVQQQVDRVLNQANRTAEEYLNQTKDLMGSQIEYKARDILAKIRAETSQRIDTILLDNLVVKGHVGQNEKHKNLGSWIQKLVQDLTTEKQEVRVLFSELSKVQKSAERGLWEHSERFKEHAERIKALTQLDQKFDKFLEFV